VPSSSARAGGQGGAADKGPTAISAAIEPNDVAVPAESRAVARLHSACFQSLTYDGSSRKLASHGFRA